MRNLTRRLLSLLCGMGLMGLTCVQGQVTQRSATAIATAKVTGTTETLPCSGSVLMSEDFENGIPATWTVIDGDGLTPRPEMQLVGGWQGREDYRDSLSNHVAATPSWYTPAGQSDDWLITPAVAVGTNSCLSWKAYSQDQFFPESYEVRVAATADTAAFLGTTPIFTTSAQSFAPGFSSVSLAAYAGQTVYIAFRQTSDDKFVLCLDDVSVANVNALDIGAYTMSYGSPEPEDTVTIRFTVANYGSDTVTSFQALYKIDGGPAKFMTITAVSLPPNATVSFDHDSLYVSDSLDAFYQLCAWTNLPNAFLDQDLSNDTTCITMIVGNPVGMPDPTVRERGLEIYPNPFTDVVNLRIDGLTRPERVTVTIMDLQGKALQVVAETILPGESLAVDGHALPAGMYLALVRLHDGKVVQQKLIRR
jgi:hypothetical protein